MHAPSGYSCIGEMEPETGLVFEYCLQTHAAYVESLEKKQEDKATWELTRLAVEAATANLWRQLGGQ